ncbi:response regulator [Phyllobacterium sp. YR531]|uniref:DNA-binding response regulator n=1 Tax=Phyllobacterium sp. YR531 TaxID=1144343 RepID=UPI00026FB2BB|nr:response regulator [Phyllobacterium sp. YR531]EJN00353.1 response regulator containing a CheY-like receiver domain and an HTH DNA-binding domain [Phyllobacterium sp. YR531]
MASAISFRNILVIEDQHLMRLALVQEVQSAIPNSIVHAAPSLETALDLIGTITFELILVDPGLPGFEPGSTNDRRHVISTLLERCPQAIHIVVTGTDTRKEWDEFRKLGVSGYIAKNNLRPRSMNAILDEIAEHGSSAGLVHESGSKPEIYHGSLSAREQEVLAWMRQTSAGISRKQVYEQLAEQMNIDPASAERYYKRAKAKLLKYGPLPGVI